MTLESLLNIRGMKDRDLFRISTLCALFGVSRQTVYRWIEKGLLEEVRITGRVRWITRTALVAFIAEGGVRV